MCGLRDVSFALGRGEVALVDLEEGREHTPLASLAQGLIAPDSGHVYFKGEDWAKMGVSRLSIQRGRIRRVFEHYGWISNLDVLENIGLAEGYHSGRSRVEINVEIMALARRFGIDPVPDSRPARVHSMVLRKLEWVRAFLGSPDLILLERPLVGAPKADASRLIQAVCEATRRGVAVILMADDPRVLECCETAPVRRFRMDGEQLLAV
jgi:phospholipid/cholesterol/gamma-HCH transport system ATP-binding protein